MTKQNEQDLEFVVLKLLTKKLTDLSARMDVAEKHIKCLRNMCGYLDPRKAEKVAVKANKPILDVKEKQYLEAVIRPFSNKVAYIKKIELDTSNKAYILIWSKDGDASSLPYFKCDTMYKGMEPGREYTIDELGLFKEVWLTV